jgi:FkbM family methyltransferase
VTLLAPYVITLRERSVQSVFSVLRCLYAILPPAGQWRLQRAATRLLEFTSVKSGTITVGGGFLMELNCLDYVQREIFLTGQFEAPIYYVMRDALTKGDVFVDVGAHVGFFSLCAAHLVGPNGRVLAFEPQPGAYESLQRNIAINRLKNIECFSIALSESSDVRCLYLDKMHNSGAASFAKSAHSGCSHLVQTKTYDEIAEHNRLPVPNLIKIDAEGAELLVLRGMRRLLAHARPIIICEISEWNQRQLGTDKHELFNMLSRLGYKAQLLTPARPQVVATKAIEFGYNVLFTS